MFIKCMQDYAHLALTQHQHQRATRLLSAADFQAVATGHSMKFWSFFDLDQDVAAARAALSEEEFARLWFEGRSLSMEEAITFALEESQEETNAT